MADRTLVTPATEVDRDNLVDALLTAIHTRHQLEDRMGFNGPSAQLATWQKMLGQIRAMNYPNA